MAGGADVDDGALVAGGADVDAGAGGADVSGLPPLVPTIWRVTGKHWPPWLSK